MYSTSKGIFPSGSSCTLDNTSFSGVAERGAGEGNCTGQQALLGQQAEIDTCGLNCGNLGKYK